MTVRACGCRQRICCALLCFGRGRSLRGGNDLPVSAAGRIRPLVAFGRHGLPRAGLNIGLSLLCRRPLVRLGVGSDGARRGFLASFAEPGGGRCEVFQFSRPVVDDFDSGLGAGSHLACAAFGPDRSGSPGSVDGLARVPGLTFDGLRGCHRHVDKPGGGSAGRSQLVAELGDRGGPGGDRVARRPQGAKRLMQVAMAEHRDGHVVLRVIESSQDRGAYSASNDRVIAQRQVADGFLDDAGAGHDHAELVSDRGAAPSSSTATDPFSFHVMEETVSGSDQSSGVRSFADRSGSRTTAPAAT